jgi:hypothetical protein
MWLLHGWHEDTVERTQVRVEGSGGAILRANDKEIRPLQFFWILATKQAVTRPSWLAQDVSHIRNRASAGTLCLKTQSATPSIAARRRRLQTLTRAMVMRTPTQSAWMAPPALLRLDYFIRAQPRELSRADAEVGQNFVGMFT